MEIDENYYNNVLKDNEGLKKEVSSLNRECNRKTYISSGLAALIIKTGDVDLIHKAFQIIREADNI